MAKSGTRGITITKTGKKTFTIQSAAFLSNRSPDFIRKLQKNGHLPEALRDRRGWRIYTEGQIHLMRNAFGEMPPKPRDLRTALKSVRKHWRDDYDEYPKEVLEGRT